MQVDFFISPTACPTGRHFQVDVILGAGRTREFHTSVEELQEPINEDEKQTIAWALARLVAQRLASVSHANLRDGVHSKSITLEIAP